MPPRASLRHAAHVCSAEDQYTLCIISYSIHLYQELRLDPSRSFGFTFASDPTERVDFIDKDDCRLVFSRHREELFHQPARKITQLASVFSNSVASNKMKERKDVHYLWRIKCAHRSLSPIHLLTRSLLLTEKNVLLASVATALAR